MELTQFPFKIIAKFHLGYVCEENHSCEFETSFPRKCVEIQKPLRAYEPSCKELTMTFKLPERIITSTRPPLSPPSPHHHSKNRIWSSETSLRNQFPLFLTPSDSVKIVTLLPFPPSTSLNEQIHIWTRFSSVAFFFLFIKHLEVTFTGYQHAIIYI